MLAYTEGRSPQNHYFCAWRGSNFTHAGSYPKNDCTSPQANEENNCNNHHLQWSIITPPRPMTVMTAHLNTIMMCCIWRSQHLLLLHWTWWYLSTPRIWAISKHHCSCIIEVTIANELAECNYKFRISIAIAVTFATTFALAIRHCECNYDQPWMQSRIAITNAITHLLLRSLWMCVLKLWS